MSDGADTGSGSFHRTSSNSFITSAQYKLLETIPEESDRHVLGHIQTFLANEKDKASSSCPSLIDPFTTTLKKDVLTKCHVFLWLTVLKRFGHVSLDPVRPSPLPKKAVIQLDNTLRRLRTATDPTPIRSTEPIEVQAAWYMRSIAKSLAKDRVSAILCLRSLPISDVMRPEVDRLLALTVEPQAESLWECLLENEHLLWNHRGRSFHLYKTQQDLLRAVSKDGPCLVELASPPSTGKTVMAAGLALAMPESVLVFCCVSPGVYLHVARLLFYLQISPTFVYGAHEIEPNFKISRVSWKRATASVGVDQYLGTLLKQKARAFIVDLNLCRWFLENLPVPRDRVILFLDEPTMGADGTVAFAHVPRLIASIMSSAALPSKLILSSATLPSHKQCLPLIRPWLDQYGVGADVTRIDDPILTSSISLVSMETGQIVLPHATVTSPQDLDRLVDKIFQDVVLLKAYSGLSILLMRQAYVDVLQKPVPTFLEAGLSTQHFSLASIRQYACHLLRHVGYVPAFLQWQPAHSSFPPLCVDGLALGFSPHVPGQTLIVSSHTKELAQQVVEPLIVSSKIRHLEQMLKKEMMTEKSFADQSKKMKDPEERRIFEQDQEFSPRVKFVPDDLVVHTVAHIRRHGGDDSLKTFPKEFIRRPPASSVVRFILNTSTEDWLKHAFLAGVMYTDVRLFTDANSSMATLMEASLLDGIPIAVVDTSFTYGVNVPCSNVVVLEESAKTMSRNSLIQFVNRVSRCGKTHGGKAFLCETAMTKLLGEDDGMEATTLQQAMQCSN